MEWLTKLISYQAVSWGYWLTRPPTGSTLCFHIRAVGVDQRVWFEDYLKSAWSGVRVTVGMSVVCPVWKWMPSMLPVTLIIYNAVLIAASLFINRLWRAVCILSIACNTFVTDDRKCCPLCVCVCVKWKTNKLSWHKQLLNSCHEYSQCYIHLFYYYLIVYWTGRQKHRNIWHN